MTDNSNIKNKIFQAKNPRTGEYAIVDISNGRILGHLDLPLPIGVCFIKGNKITKNSQELAVEIKKEMTNDDINNKYSEPTLYQLNNEFNTTDEG